MLLPEGPTYRKLKIHNMQKNYQRYLDLVSALNGEKSQIKNRDGALCVPVRCPAHDDRSASATLFLNANGSVVGKCHAGCSAQDIARAIKARGLWRSDEPQHSAKAKVLYHEYQWVDGSVVFVKARKYLPNGGKKMWFSTPIPEGEERRPLYRLPKLLQSTGPVYWCEGETNAEALESWGLTVTSLFATSAPWCSDYDEWMRDREVIILEDNDHPGRHLTWRLLTHLVAVGCKCKVLRLPGLRDSEDVGDWIKRGGTLEQFLAYASLEAYTTDPGEEPQDPKKAAQVKKEAQKERKAEIQETFRLTDLGNSERYVEQWAEHVRYVRQWREWVRWDGQRWGRGDDLAVQLAKKTVRSIGENLPEGLDEDSRKEIKSWAHKSEDSSRIFAMLRLAASAEKLGMNAETLDRDRDIINVANGTLHLPTLTLRPPQQADLITKLVPVPFDPSARCPRFITFLEQIFNHDEELIAFIQRSLGYCLSGSVAERCMFIAWGPKGNNGKSTLLSVVQHVLGADYADKLPAASLTEVRADRQGVPNDIAKLHGKRFVWSSEAEETARLKVALIKEITGNEPLTARFLREEFFTFEPQFKIWLATNPQPVIKGSDEAIWRRLKLIPFDVSIPAHQINPEMQADLLQEATGIFAWLVQGYAAWRDAGLQTPDKVSRTCQSVREDNNQLLRFIDEQCVRGEGLSVQTQALYEAYKKWCESSGEYPLSLKKLSTQLLQAGIASEKRHPGRMFVLGVGLGVMEEIAEPLPWDVGGFAD